jgi:1,4-dihydroxy-2-naphthoate octaprenyltransferase
MNKETKNLLLHLRLPFSIFLMPVFWFALSQTKSTDYGSVALLFAVLHLLVYPSSNGYNSYMDNDTESIGGIKNPPKVPKTMFLVSVLMDILAFGILAFSFKIAIAILLLVYILASRAYSYRGIRLKKYPIIGFLTVAICQGCLIFTLSMWAIEGDILFNAQWFLSIFIAFLLIGAGYPLTQIYQHKQDSDDGVKTLSLLLGIRGTFVFSAVLFALLGASMTLFFIQFGNGISDVLLLTICLSPVAFYFANWMRKTFLDPKNADFEHTMAMNKIGSFFLNLFFILLILKIFFVK